MRDLSTLAEVAALLGIDLKKLRLAAYRGQLACTPIGRMLFFDATQIAAIKASRGIAWDRPRGWKKGRKRSRRSPNG
jgi:hypothetical protein